MSNNLTAAEKVLADLNLTNGYEFAPGITIAYPSQRVINAAYEVTKTFPDDESELELEQVIEVFKILMGDQYAAVMEYLETFPVEGYPTLFADLFVNVMSMVPRDMDTDGLTDSLSAEVVSRWKALNPGDADLFDD